MFQTPPANPRQILTVTRLNRLARTLLESQMGLIWLSAEVSNFVAAASGHWYFTLKDNKAQVRAAMFKNTNRLVRRRPKEGDKILVRASVGIYEARGDYQLIVEHLEDDGEGRLKQAFDALKAKLLAEGLFDASNKRPMPETVRKIGLITSASGAALHDVLSVLGRRSPATEVIIYPSLVQGEMAPAQLIEAINTANARQEVEVILLTRGGGSMEDLWCFNDEALARTIAASSLPIVSAVGHEVDVTIADFVADMRAPTPSAAAEQLSQDTRAHLQRIDTLVSRLTRSIRTRLKTADSQLSARHQHLRALHPATQIRAQARSLTRLSRNMEHMMHQRLRYAKQQFIGLDERLNRATPEKRILNAQQQLQDLKRRLIRSMSLLQHNAEQKLGAQLQLLQSVSPLATLARGYSITFTGTDAVVRTEQVAAGDTLTTRVADGEITSTVSDTRTLSSND